jgi:hypothetical protein
MNAGERVRILSGPGAGHEGNVVSVHAGYVKVRTADFGGGEASRVITKATRFVQRVQVFAQFQGREFKPYVPPRVAIRDGALDFKACPSHYGELAQS